jgi:hypothetical protein
MLYKHEYINNTIYQKNLSIMYSIISLAYLAISKNITYKNYSKI